MLFKNGKWQEEIPEIFDELFIKRGYAVYETIRTYNNKPFALKLHYERLKRSADFLGIELPSFLKIKEIILDGIQKCDFLGEKRIYVYAFLDMEDNIMVYIEPLHEFSEEKESGVVLAIARERKPLFPIIPHYVKTTLMNYNFYY